MRHSCIAIYPTHTDLIFHNASFLSLEGDLSSKLDNPLKMTGGEKSWAAALWRSRSLILYDNCLTPITCSKRVPSAVTQSKPLSFIRFSLQKESVFCELWSTFSFVRSRLISIITFKRVYLLRTSIWARLFYLHFS